MYKDNINISRAVAEKVGLKVIKLFQLPEETELQPENKKDKND